MKRIIALLFLGLLLLGGCGPRPFSSWEVFRGNSYRTGLIWGNAPLHPGRLFTFNSGAPIVCSPVVDEKNRVYCSNLAGRFFCLDGAGKLLWSYQGEKPAYSAGLDSKLDLAVFSGGDYLWGFSLDGKLKWKFPVDSPVESSPVFTPEGKILVGGGEGTFYCLDDKGKLLWTYQQGDSITSSPALSRDGKAVYFGTDDYYICALDLKGSLLWKVKAHAEVTSTPAVAQDGRIVAGCDNGEIYCLDATGRVLWRLEAGAAISGSPALGAKGDLYLGLADRGVIAVNAKGRILWKAPTDWDVLSSPLIDKRGNIYLSLTESRLLAFSPLGKQIIDLKLSEPFYDYPPMFNFSSSLAMDGEGRLYLGSYNGNLYGVGEPR